MYGAKKVTLSGCYRRDHRRSDPATGLRLKAKQYNNMFQTVDRDLPIVHYARLEVEPRCRRFMYLYSVHYNTSVNFISLRINAVLCRSAGRLRIYFVSVRTRRLQRPTAAAVFVAAHYRDALFLRLLLPPAFPRAERDFAGNFSRSVGNRIFTCT